jgi:hypothetical protein
VEVIDSQLVDFYGLAVGPSSAPPAVTHEEADYYTASPRYSTVPVGPGFPGQAPASGEIIGVVGNIRRGGLESEGDRQLYVHQSTFDF